MSQTYRGRSTILINCKRDRDLIENVKSCLSHNRKGRGYRVGTFVQFDSDSSVGLKKGEYDIMVEMYAKTQNIAENFDIILKNIYKGKIDTALLHAVSS